MSDFSNLNEYITADLKAGISDAIKLSLAKVKKEQPVNKMIDREVNKTGYSKIIKKGFTP